MVAALDVGVGDLLDVSDVASVRASALGRAGLGLEFETESVAEVARVARALMWGEGSAPVASELAAA